jgi:hypothetical protein
LGSQTKLKTRNALFGGTVPNLQPSPIDSGSKLLPSNSYDGDLKNQTTAANSDDQGARLLAKNGLIMKKNVTSLAEMLGFKHL